MIDDNMIEIESNYTFMFVGPSGSGKTTIQRFLISGKINEKENPTDNIKIFEKKKFL